MDTAVLKRGIIQAFDPVTWTATVQVLPSQGNYLAGVPVAKHLLAAEIVPGDACALLFFNELNPADAIIMAVYGVPSAAPYRQSPAWPAARAARHLPAMCSSSLAHQAM